MGRITIEGVPYCCYGKSEAEVKRKIKEHRKNVIKDGNIIKRITVGKWIEEWIQVNKKSLIAPSKSRLLRTYKNQIQGVEEGRLLLRMQLNSVTKNDIQRLINKLEETLSYSTVKKAHLLLCEAFKDAKENDYIFISILVNDENRDIASIAEIVGHNDIRVTLKYARHTNKEKKTATMKTLDNLFYMD